MQFAVPETRLWQCKLYASHVHAFVTLLITSVAVFLTSGYPGVKKKMPKKGGGVHMAEACATQN